MSKVPLVAGFEVAEILMLTAGVLAVAAIGALCLSSAKQTLATGHVPTADRRFRGTAEVRSPVPAIDRKTGARGLRSIVEAILLDTMFDLPSLENGAYADGRAIGARPSDATPAAGGIRDRP